MLRLAKNLVRKHILRDLPEKSVRRWVERELDQRIVRSGPFRNMKYEARSRSIGLRVFMDIEGGESILLDPLVVPELSMAWIIVEAHDCFVPGTTALPKRRFSISHRIEEVWSRQRRPEDFPLRYHAGWFDPSMYYLEYMGERSVKTNWLYLEPIALGDQIREP